jgi:TM2 domain-containing membrane protein YozV
VVPSLVYVEACMVELCALACMCVCEGVLYLLICFAVLCWLDYSWSWCGWFDVVVSAVVVLVQVYP